MLEWEKIFANPVSNKELVSKIHNSFSKLSSYNPNPIQKWLKDMKRQIHKANRHIKRCSASLAIREVQIKTVISYYYIPIKIAEMENSTVTSVGEDMEKLNHLHVAGGIIKWYSHYRKCLSVF